MRFVEQYREFCYLASWAVVYGVFRWDQRRKRRGLDAWVRESRAKVYRARRDSDFRP